MPSALPRPAAQAPGNRPRHWRAVGTAAVLLLGLDVSAAIAQDPASAPEVEESDVGTLPPTSPHWFLGYSSFSDSARLVDGGSGKVLGAVHIAKLSNIVFEPAAAKLLVAETIWTKGNRGRRQDMLTVYDGHTLKLEHEIPLPGRLLTGNRRHMLDVSSDGRFAYVYDLSPASAVVVIDLQRRKVARTVEIAGCGGVFATGPARFMSLCGDGTVASVDVGAAKAAVAQSAVFFNPDEDPVFDNSVVDRASGRLILVSYSGMVYEVAAGSPARVAQSWSLQEAAGMARGTTKALQPGWLPGGRQLVAYNAHMNRLYILMHLGEFWSHKESGSELWEVDVAARKVLRRHRLDEAADSIAISQDDKPLLILSAGEDDVRIMDPATFEILREIKGVPARLIAVLP